MDLRQYVSVASAVMALACDPSQSPHENDEAPATGNNEQSEAGPQSNGGSSTSNRPSGQGPAAAGDASAPSGAATSANDAGAPRASGSEASHDAGTPSGSSDAARPRSEWEGLVTLDASVTIGPDGAIVSGDGGFAHYDPASAGPVLNPQAQMACLMLASNICNRSADCQGGLAQISPSRRNQLVASCQDTLLRNHNCNRAISTTSEFSACAESVKTHDCMTIFANDFATACIDQVMFQP